MSSKKKLSSEYPFSVDLARVQQQTLKDVTVHISIPTAEEAESYFDIDMSEYGIQPIWIRIENTSDINYWLIPYAIDPSYYTADEVALITGKHLGKEDYFRNRSLLRNNVLPFFQQANSATEGYIYASGKSGGRFVDIHLTGRDEFVRMRFSVLLPTQVFDYEKSELRERYQNLDQLRDLTIDELRTYMRDSLPSCTTNSEGNESGDPLNVVLIGSGALGISALSASGWQFTEAITVASIRRMIGAAIKNVAFQTAPISALYTFDRKQDVALQLGRPEIKQRNHMRLWLAPVRCEGEPVWIGQISRDIGVKLTTKSKSLFTHIIDPFVDEAREYLLHSLFCSESVRKYAFVKGVGASNDQSPRDNLTDDPYITDGLRMVVWLSSTPVPSHKAENLGWNASADPALELKNQSTLNNKGNSALIDPL
ncbi:MAG: LssY C-terminal domain-containing protein [Pseudomonadota bacterium]